MSNHIRLEIDFGGIMTEYWTRTEAVFCVYCGANTVWSGIDDSEIGMSYCCVSCSGCFYAHIDGRKDEITASKIKEAFALGAHDGEVKP